MRTCDAIVRDLFEEDRKMGAVTQTCKLVVAEYIR